MRAALAFLATASAFACAACGPTQYSMDLDECVQKYTGSQGIACIPAADRKRDERDQQLAAFGAVVGGATAVAAPAPPPAPAVAANASPAPAPGVPKTVKVDCSDHVGVTGYTTCKVRQ